MPFTLPDLPYASEALAPHMSSETLEFHHGKHHRAYVKKTNELLEEDQRGGSLIEVVRSAKQNGDRTLFNHSAQLWNHSFFWQCLAPADGQKPSGKLAQMIDEDFGGTEQLLKAIEKEAVGHFSNGWAWLLLDRDSLRITTFHDADTPLVHDGMQPLFTLDVWEHAYYIDYRNERPRFASTVLANIVNWDFVARNLDGRGAGRADQESTTERATEPTA